MSSKRFRDRDVLKDVSFQVPSGEALCILGRSGVGKSVTLKLLIGLLQPDKGEVCIKSEDISHFNEGNLSRVRRKMGFLFQSAALFDSFSVGDNLALPMKRLSPDKSKVEIDRAVDKTLRQVGLDQDKGKNARRTLRRHAQTCWPRTSPDLLLRVKKDRHTTMVIVTHDIRGARRIADKVAVLENGALVGLGSFADLENNQNDTVRKLLSGVLSMKPYRGAVAAFLLLGIILFGVGLFLLGNQHKAFSHHIDFYTDLANVDGLNPRAHVRVNGFDAGQITSVGIPQRPTEKFRLKLHVDGKLKNLIRSDSVVTVETDGLVGDKFLLIHSGSDKAQPVGDGGTIPGKEPIELSAILQKVSGTIDQANSTIADVRTRLDGTLDTITNAVNNTNGIVTGIRHGHGPVGALLNDPQITSDLKTTMANTRQATAKLNQVSVQAGQIVTDFQSRNLVGKVDQSFDNVRDASKQLDQTSQQINRNVTEAFSPDASGHTAGENLQGTLANINTATSNMAMTPRRSSMSSCSGAILKSAVSTPSMSSPQTSTGATPSSRPRPVPANGSTAATSSRPTATVISSSPQPASSRSTASPEVTGATC